MWGAWPTTATTFIGEQPDSAVELAQEQWNKSLRCHVLTSASLRAWSFFFRLELYSSRLLSPIFLSRMVLLYIFCIFLNIVLYVYRIFLFFFFLHFDNYFIFDILYKAYRLVSLVANKQTNNKASSTEKKNMYIYVICFYKIVPIRSIVKCLWLDMPSLQKCILMVHSLVGGTAIIRHWLHGVVRGIPLFFRTYVSM